MLGVPCLGRLALEHLVPPIDPTLGGRLTEIDLMCLMAAGVSIEQDPGGFSLRFKA